MDRSTWASLFAFVKLLVPRKASTTVLALQPTSTLVSSAGSLMTLTWSSPNRSMAVLMSKSKPPGNLLAFVSAVCLLALASAVCLLSVCFSFVSPSSLSARFSSEVACRWYFLCQRHPLLAYAKAEEAVCAPSPWTCTSDNPCRS